MKTINLPAGALHIQFDELAHMIAIALFPLGDSPTDGESLAYGGACINLEAELLQAVQSGALPVLDPLTFGLHPYPVGRALETALVSVDALRAFLAGRPITVSTAPEQKPATPALEAVAPLDDEVKSIEQIRFEVLASRTELIEAFSLYGVELKIFKALKDRPGLMAACRVKGRGQRGSRAEPMFCPFEVINWLVKTGVKEKPRLNDFMGWHILETKFPNVYAEKSMCDPRQN